MSLVKIRAVSPPSNCTIFWLDLPTSATRDQLLFRSPTADCAVDYGSPGKLSKLGGSSCGCRVKIMFKILNKNLKLYFKSISVLHCVSSGAAAKVRKFS